MKAFLILLVMAVTLLGLSNSQVCNSSCQRRNDPHCGVTAECLVHAVNLCTLGYKACILNQFKLSPIIDVLPGFCPTFKPICPRKFQTFFHTVYNF